ncbi:CdaR family transcriptional regulator [Paenibacillus segetis]|uniref:Transcriptional regulator n=1 Tax=Paenibacillus segetis TaxID=1325360 RepID=A0ABQ1YP05_9BACL|nr:sugar diacid recognition domain-containing protein [Paenibacillus segetis]GGH31181.1 transcriptional regulator [Paenibacillus segetis]
MYHLSPSQAQEIVDKMMKDIPYNINIMNEQGIIIGSGNLKRVGTVHQGAVEALSTGKLVEVWTDGKSAKKGTNEPIVIDHKRVGVIGITGDPDEVRPFCNIVKTVVTLLIEQGAALKSLEHEANRKKAFLELLLSHRGAYSQRFRREAQQYNIDLMLKTVVLCIRNLKKEQEKSKLYLLFPSFLLDEDTHLLIVQNNDDLDKLIKHLTENHKDVLISKGKSEANIADSYYQAKSALNVAHALKLPTQVVSYEEVNFLVKLSHTNLTGNHNAVSKLEDTLDGMETLRSFINHNCSVSLTAAELNIHRNTLQYRLKRIHSLTGKDPRNVLDLFELIFGLLSLYK